MVKKEESNEPVFMALSKDNIELLQTIKDAQASLGFLYAVHDQHSKTLGVTFAIKVMIKDGENRAHVWYLYTGEEEGLLTGEKFELPDELKEHDRIRVRPDEVEDWMINDHGHLFGGFSIRLQRKYTTEEKRAEFDEYTGIDVYREVDYETGVDHTSSA